MYALHKGNWKLSNKPGLASGGPMWFWRTVHAYIEICNRKGFKKSIPVYVIIDKTVLKQIISHLILMFSYYSWNLRYYLNQKLQARQIRLSKLEKLTPHSSIENRHFILGGPINCQLFHIFAFAIFRRSLATTLIARVEHHGARFRWDSPQHIYAGVTFEQI